MIIALKYAKYHTEPISCIIKVKWWFFATKNVTEHDEKAF